MEQFFLFTWGQLIPEIKEVACRSPLQFKLSFQQMTNMSCHDHDNLTLSLRHEQKSAYRNHNVMLYYHPFNLHFCCLFKISSCVNHPGFMLSTFWHKITQNLGDIKKTKLSETLRKLFTEVKSLWPISGFPVLITWQNIRLQKSKVLSRFSVMKFIIFASTGQLVTPSL